MNGIMVNSDAAGVTMYYGAGAGSRETASAVVADLVDVARSPASVPPLGFHDEAAAPHAIAPIASLCTRHYLRVGLVTPAAAPDVLDVLTAHGIAAEQGGTAKGTLVLLTKPARESDVAAAVRKIAALPCVLREPARFRVEDLAHSIQSDAPRMPA